MNNASPSAITHIEYETERSIIFKWKSRLFMCNVCVIPVPNAMKRAYSVWNNSQSQMSRVRNWLKTL